MRWHECSAMVMASSASLLRALALFLLLLNVAQCIDSSEVSALLGFKNSLVDVYGHTNDWSASDSTPCSWTGVQCNELGRVAALKLGNMNLSGSISGPDLARLSSLVNISLEQNNLTGSLPGELASLVHLRWLNISHNTFGSEFPANISLLPKLEVLDAYNNNFRGLLPPQLGDLKSIRHLHLGGSYFSGSIPPELGRLSTLEYLALSGNSLGGRIPPELGNLSHLKELYLGYYNSFEGGIPRELGHLTSLAKLDIAYCGLTGPIPREIGNMSLLDTIFLQINNLSGSIPREIGSLVQLRSLDLSNNLLTGRLPDEMSMLENLELLNLFRNKLEGSIPTFIGDLPNLQVLNLWANHFTGVIPPLLGIGSLALTGLDLSSNSLTGTIPEGLCSGGKLQILILYGNQLSGGIPAALGDCSTLVRVRLGYNRLSGSLPPRILGLPDVQMLELVGNQLDGSIPAAPIAATSLESLDLSSNQLRGGIPAAIGNLSNLKNLLLSDNHLTGPLPASIGELKQLSILDASGNSLSGQIPASIGSCSRLASLDLSRNQLEGEIPESMGGLQALDALNVSHNELSGKIPQELARIASLTSGDFSYNRLFGPIPSTGQFGFFNASSFQGNSGLCGTPVSRACSDNGSGGAKQSGGKGATRRHNSGDGGIYGWAIGAMFLAALLVAVIGTTVFIRRHSDKVGEWAVRLRKLGGGAAARRRPWRLTAFQKLDFAADDVVECLSEENVIGRGMSGIVYRGMMPSGDIVAVKRLTSANVARTKSNGGSSHDDFGFSAEIQTLGKIRHMNIVKLLGFCSNQETNLLVYEYMPNGSLGEMIHGPGKKGSAPLDWETRYKIAVQAANGLCYLHHDCSPLIVHRDVKSNNILLDSNMRAHVADFGLAKLVHGGGKSESMSSIAGSYGYIAPEYAYTLKVNEKSDIYSFGVVLLELVTGRRPIDPEFGDGVDIVQWVRKKIQTRDGVLDILDSKMGGPDMLPLHEAMLVLRVALLCSSDSPSERPTMRDVVQMLTDVKPKLRDSSKEFGSNRAVLPPPVAASDRLIDV